MATLRDFNNSRAEHRYSHHIAKYLLRVEPKPTRIYDVGCGQGSVSIALASYGFDPKSITMVDGSQWGLAWKAISSGSLNPEDLIELIRPSDDGSASKRSYANRASSVKKTMIAMRGVEVVNDRADNIAFAAGSLVYVNASRCDVWMDIVARHRPVIVDDDCRIRHPSGWSGSVCLSQRVDGGRLLGRTRSSQRWLHSYR